MKLTVTLLASVGLVALSACHHWDPPLRRPEPKSIEKLDLASVKNPSSVGKLILAGQPTKEGLADLKGLGCQVVIDLRTEGEVEWDEPATVKDLGMEYHRVAFRAPETLTDEVFDEVRTLLKTPSPGKKLLHCGSANRVGAVWLAHRVLDQAVPWNVALAEAKAVGMTTPEYETRAKEYIDARR